MTNATPINAQALPPAANAVGERISVRLTADIQQKLTQLRYQTQESTSHIVSEALAEYLDKRLPKPKMSVLEAFQHFGLLGAISDGPADLSVNYKDVLTEYLEEKHGYR